VPLKLDQQNILAKFRATIYRKYNNICPTCGESLLNGESVDLPHLILRRNAGQYSLTNICPLHRICPQQITPQRPPLAIKEEK
jgi:hypothetical protein